VRAITELELPDTLGAPALVPEGAAAVQPAFAALLRARESGFAAIDQWMCRAPGGTQASDFEQARRRLVVEAAAARARSVAMQQARRIAGEQGARWVAHHLYGGPWPRPDLDPGMEQLLLPLVTEARSVSEQAAQTPSAGFDPFVLPNHCTPLLFAY
jgi:hypothetical protein